MCPESTWPAGRRPALLPAGAIDGRVQERGSSLVEYCLLMALIALVTIGALAAFGSARDQVLERSASSILGP